MSKDNARQAGLTESEFIRDWQEKMGHAVPLTTTTVTRYLSLAAQSEDARNPGGCPRCKSPTAIGCNAMGCFYLENSSDADASNVATGHAALRGPLTPEQRSRALAMYGSDSPTVGAALRLVEHVSATAYANGFHDGSAAPAALAPKEDKSHLCSICGEPKVAHPSSGCPVELPPPAPAAHPVAWRRPAYPLDVRVTEVERDCWLEQGWEVEALVVAAPESKRTHSDRDGTIRASLRTDPAPASQAVNGIELAAIGRAHFGNPIPKAWYAAAKELLTYAQQSATSAVDALLAGHFVKRSMHGPWVEVDPTKEGGTPLYLGPADAASEADKRG